MELHKKYVFLSTYHILLEIIYRKYLGLVLVVVVVVQDFCFTTMNRIGEVDCSSSTIVRVGPLVVRG